MQTCLNTCAYTCEAILSCKKCSTVHWAKKKKKTILCMIWNLVFPSEIMLEGVHEIFITQLTSNISIYCIVALSKWEFYLVDLWICGGVRFLSASHWNRGVNMPAIIRITMWTEYNISCPVCKTLSLRIVMFSMRVVYCCLSKTQDSLFSMRLSIGEIAVGCMSWLCRPGGWIPVWWCYEMWERSGSG